MIQKIYQINEFAALCGVTKHTLYHYDDIGLLKPCLIHENGYRYYSIEQVYKFQIISILKKAGTPLKEIKTYLKHQSPDIFLDVLNNKLLDLEKEAMEINRMCGLLSDTIEVIKQSANIEIGKIQISHCEEEYLIATPIESSSAVSADEKEMLKSISKHIQYCAENSLSSNLHIGEIVLQKNIEAGIFTESYYYNRIKHKAHDKHLFIKPAGLYATLFHRGSYESLYTAYQNVVSSIEELDYSICGNIYEEDVINYFSEQNPERFILKISLHIKQK